MWDITKAKTRYNGVTIGRSNNINIYKTYIGDGDSYIYTPAAYSSSENNNGSGTYTWSVTNGTGRAYVSSSGRLTGTSPGAVTLKLAYGSYSDSITVTILPLGEGQYFLENRKSGKRADIYGPYMTAGTVIHQWSIHSGNSQKWQFRILGDGYYTIRSVNSGSNFYIGVDNDSADQDAAVVLRSGTITDGMKFNVEIISDGVYKLIPKTGQSAGRVLAVSTSNSNANGTAVKQLAYKSDTTYNDEWLIYESIMSYINYYDSSMPTADLAYISSANQLANKVYGDIYNVHFKMDGAAKRYTAAKTDMCSTGQNTPCDNNICGSNCFGDHHKNINAISNQLYNGSRETNHLYVLWTDRPSETYCYENRSGAHERFSRNALAVVCGSRPVIHMMDIVGTSAADREALMAITLVHETAHSFGMPDVYNNAGHDDPNNFICVMEAYDLEGGDKYYNKIKKNASLAFCDSCKASLESLVPTKVIRGN